MTTYRNEVFCRYMQRSSLRIRELGGDTPETGIGGDTPELGKDNSQGCPPCCPPCCRHLRRGVPRLPGRGRLDPGPVRPGRFRVLLLPLEGPSPPFSADREKGLPRGDAPGPS